MHLILSTIYTVQSPDASDTQYGTDWHNDWITSICEAGTVKMKILWGIIILLCVFIYSVNIIAIL